MIGSQITELALPLTAVSMLHASAWQMGLLTAASSLPWLLFALVVGVWIDRLRRRPVMVLADTGRAFLVGLVPLASAFHFLRMEVLYASALGAGTLTVFFDLADHAYLPGLVGRERLVEGNGKLQLSQSVSMLVGPGLAGLLVEALTAPLALLFDAFSFLLSAVSIALIRKPEAAPERQEGRLGSDIVEGLRAVFGHPVLRALAGYAGTINLVDGMLMTILILYLTRQLGLGAIEIGLGLSVGALGGITGALGAAALSGRLGVGRTLMTTSLLHGAGMLLLLAASGPHWARLAVGTSAAMVVLFGSAASNVLSVSLRQAITPDRLLGRMTATVRFVIWGINPLAALLGGALGQWLGLRPTLVVVAVLSFLALPWLYFSPVRGMRERPAAGQPDLPPAPAVGG